MKKAPAEANDEEKVKSMGFVTLKTGEGRR